MQEALLNFYLDLLWLFLTKHLQPIAKESLSKVDRGTKINHPEYTNSEDKPIAVNSFSVFREE